MTEQTSEPRPVNRGAKIGTVLSRGGKNTIKVQITTLVKQPTYGKYLQRRQKFAVHDPKDQANVGDQVEIVPCRRLSKTKAWRLTRIVRSAGIIQ